MTDFSSDPKSRGRGVRAAEVQIQPIFLLTSCSDVVINYQSAVEISSALDQKGSIKGCGKLRYFYTDCVLR